MKLMKLYTVIVPILLIYGEPVAWHSALQAAATESDSIDPYAVEFAAGLIVMGERPLRADRSDINVHKQVALEV